MVDQSGGIQLVNTRTGGVPSSCNSPVPATLATLRQTNFANDLLHMVVSANLVITGSVPTAGDWGVGTGSNLDAGNATVSADPDQHTVSVNGTVIRFNGASALFLNQTFPQPLSTYDASMDFASGDLFGTVDLTVTTR